MPNSAPGKEELIAVIQAGNALAVEQLYWKGHCGFGR